MKLTKRKHEQTKVYQTKALEKLKKHKLAQIKIQHHSDPTWFYFSFFFPSIFYYFNFFNYLLKLETDIYIYGFKSPL